MKCENSAKLFLWVLLLMGTAPCFAIDLKKCWQLDSQSDEWQALPPEACDFDAMIKYAHEHSAECAALMQSPFAKSLPTSALKSLPTDCKKIEMNRSLDLRLNQLKSEDPAQFKKEMRLQAEFLRATKQYCSRKCFQTATTADNADELCWQAAYNYRQAQALKLNQKENLLLEGNAPATNGSKAYETFAKQLCEPNSPWFKPLPENCVSKVLSNLVASFKSANPGKGAADSCW